MARLNQDQLKPLAVLLGLLGVWVLAPAGVKRLAEVSFFEFQAPAWVASSRLEEIQTFLSLQTRSKRELAEAGRNVARVNAALTLQNERLEPLARENAALTDLLGLPSHDNYRYVIARVVRRDISAWADELLIRRGRSDGLETGMGVVFGGGVVGRIVETGRYVSRVQLVSSPEFRIAGHFEGDWRPVAYQGVVNPPFGRPRGRVSNAPPDMSPGGELAPLRLVTSSMGGTFPEGLTIGEVPELEPDANGLFQRGPVLLDRRLLAIQEVAVLLPTLEGAVRQELAGQLGEVD